MEIGKGIEDEDECPQMEKLQKLINQLEKVYGEEKSKKQSEPEKSTKIELIPKESILSLDKDNQNSEEKSDAEVPKDSVKEENTEMVNEDRNL